MNKNTKIILIITLILGVLIMLSKNKAMEIWDDYWTNKRINSLHPNIRNDVKKFINEAAKLGIFLRVTSGLRTFSEQTALYAIGRTVDIDKQIVTNAKAGESYHNYGLAFDVVPMIDGKPVWNDSSLWARVGALGKKFGFYWGGDFKSIKDYPHFQKTFGLSTNQLKMRDYDGDLINGYVRLT